MGQLELPYTAGGNVKWRSHFGNLNLNVCLFSDPEIALLGLCGMLRLAPLAPDR